MSIVRAPEIPDSRRLAKVKALCETANPYVTGPDADQLFLEAMRESVLWHQENSPFYRRLLGRVSAATELKSLDDLAELPALPASFFKAHEVVSVPREQVSLVLTSSGTTGQKSQMFFDDWSIRAPQRMVEFIFNHYGWTTPDEKANYILFTYEVERDSKLGTAYTDNFLCGFAPPQDVFYALRRTGTGSHEFDVFGTIATLERYAAEGLPVRIFGFPAFLHFTLKRMRDLGHPGLKLSKDSFVFLGGGWKGHADQAVSQHDLYRAAHEQLGIPDERLRDGFGSVEHCVPYIECANHHFHVSTWSRVLIRDVATLKPLTYGQPGFLNFISPYITSVPAQSVMMGDLASLHPASACGCGLETPWFEVHGRAGTSRNKSCAITAAELLKGMS
jgi:hypothetical protein